MKWYINYCTNMFSVFTKLPCGRNSEISNRSIQNPYEQLPNICNQLTIRNALLYTAVTRNLSAKNRTQQCILKSITKNKVFYTVLNKFDYCFTTTTTTVPPFFAVLRSSVLCSLPFVRCRSLFVRCRGILFSKEDNHRGGGGVSRGWGNAVGMCRPVVLYGIFRKAGTLLASVGRRR